MNYYFLDNPMSNSSFTLHFESRFIYGSCEHFFHFMWGYFLPALHLIARDEGKKHTYIFRSCGPLMDQHIHAVMQANHLKYSIEAKDFTSTDSEDIVLPRWDVRLIMPLWLNTSDSCYPPILTIQAYLANNQHLLESYRAMDLGTAIAQVKAFILKGFALPPAEQRASFQRLLVLKRSEEPEFYRKGIGAAAISGYGTGRRSLKNPEEIANELTLAGIPTRVFEPGQHSLREQIIAYSECNGMIGIRGAEFANLIWLPAGSDVVLVDPMNINQPPIHRYSAALLHLNYHQIDTNEGAHPSVDASQLISMLSEYK
jgi:hypothetical protein